MCGTTPYLFVYGLLMQKAGSQMNTFLSDRAELIARARVMGKLYQVAHYPGMVISPNPNDEVHGELYYMEDPDSVLPQLDEFEEYFPDDIEGSVYIRVKKPVKTDSGAKHTAWMYLYNQPVENLKEIPSGNFIDTL